MMGDKMDLFCKIIEGSIPSYTIFEDDIVKVFLDVNPKVNGHMLIIPKQHYLDLFDIDNKTLMHILEVAKQMDSLLKENLHSQGLTLIQNNGLYQEVKHFHLHLHPHYEKKQKILPIEEVYKKLTNKS